MCCSPPGGARALAERNALATSEATGGRISYEEALQQELAILGPLPPLDGSTRATKK